MENGMEKLNQETLDSKPENQGIQQEFFNFDDLFNIEYPGHYSFDYYNRICAFHKDPGFKIPETDILKYIEDFILETSIQISPSIEPVLEFSENPNNTARLVFNLLLERHNTELLSKELPLFLKYGIKLREIYEYLKSENAWKGLAFNLEIFLEENIKIENDDLGQIFKFINIKGLLSEQRYEIFSLLVTEGLIEIPDDLKTALKKEVNSLIKDGRINLASILSKTINEPDGELKSLAHHNKTEMIPLNVSSLETKKVSLTDILAKFYLYELFEAEISQIAHKFPNYKSILPKEDLYLLEEVEKKHEESTKVLVDILRNVLLENSVSDSDGGVFGSVSGLRNRIIDMSKESLPREEVLNYLACILKSGDATNNKEETNSYITTEKLTYKLWVSNTVSDTLIDTIIHLVHVDTPVIKRGKTASKLSVDIKKIEKFLDMKFKAKDIKDYVNKGAEFSVVLSGGETTKILKLLKSILNGFI